MRKGYTLVEALTSIFVLAIGTLALTALIFGGVMTIRRTNRELATQQSFQNASSLVRMIVPSQLSNLKPGTFLWIYHPQKSPDLPVGNRTPVANSLLYPPLGLSLDIQGPYEVARTQRPYRTGQRVNPHDPERYTYAISVRPVVHSIPNPAPPPASMPQLDGTLVDVSVVIFEGYYEDPSDPKAPRPYVLNNASLAKQGITLVAANPSQPINPQPPTRAIIVDGDNGYVYHLLSGTIKAPARANSRTIIVLPRAVEVLELGIIAVR
jgi:hypothetical protein